MTIYNRHDFRAFSSFRRADVRATALRHCKGRVGVWDAFVWAVAAPAPPIDAANRGQWGIEIVQNVTN